ncbi:MAG: hypothetical protein AMJ38_03135 [Dehalococcoidia bacterium DG_22]|nr:MAG: hypothetical protein AMJ38_03135 [Dehalococcoidia bacterium DG_22]
MPLPKPDFPAIKKVYEDVKNEWTELGDQDEEMLALHEMRYHVPYHEPNVEGYEVKPIRSGWTKRAVKAFKSYFADKPVFRHKAGIGATQHRQSERIEAMLNVLPWAVAAAFGSFWPEILEDCGKFGRGWTEVLPKRARWVEASDYPRKGKGIDPETGQEIPKNESSEDYKKRRESWKKTALPAVAIRHLPAAGVYAEITENYRVLKAVRYVEISLAEAAEKWPEKFEERYNDPTNDGTEKVSCYEYVDREWVAQAAEYDDIQELVQKPWRHDMGICPWVLFEALTTSATEPHKRWEPVLLEIKDVGIEMDAQLTRQAMITHLWPFPQPVIEDPDNPPEGLEKGYEHLALKPPQALVLYKGKTFKIENFQLGQADTEQLWDKLERAKERALPDVGAEIAEGSSGTPAWTWRLRGQMLERDMKCATDNLSLSAKRLGQAILLALQSKWLGNETLYIGKETKEGTQTIQLSQDDMKGQVDRIEASVKPSKLVDRNANLGAMKMAIDMGLGKRWALEELGEYENPQEILDEALLEEIEYSDPIKQRLVIDVMERADLIEEREARVPPGDIAAMTPFLPVGFQQAIRNIQGGIAMPGVGRGGVPMGAHPNTMTRTGVGTAQQGGPKPWAEEPGGATEV